MLQGKEAALGDISAALSTADSEQEKGVLSRIKTKFTIMSMFDEFPINHSMPITIKNKNK